MEDLSLHILDIAENAISAKAKKIEILIIEEPGEDRLTIEIQDDGMGMDEEVSKKAVDPFFTTRSSRKVGLGLSLMAQAAQEAGGMLRIESKLNPELARAGAKLLQMAGFSAPAYGQEMK